MSSSEYEDLAKALAKLQKQLDNVQADVASINLHTKRLEKAVGRQTLVRPVWVKLRYIRRDKELLFNNEFPIRFDGNEAALLETMFYEKTGKPKQKKFYCIEVADRFKKINSGPTTAKAVHQTIARIDEKVKQKTGLEAFYITTKEFHNLAKE